MAISINRVCISGNLTRDPELRQTPGGTQVLGVGVAVNDRRKNQRTGQWEDVPNFVDCVVFGNRAEALSTILHKGDKVAVEGRLRYSSWEARDGTRRSKLEVVAEEVDLMQRPRQAAQQPGMTANVPRGQGAPVPAYATAAYAAPAPATQAYRPPPGQAPAAADPYDADIPF
jgi:single-strand DNA-binding protein